MDELPAEARAFLESQKHAHDPPAGMSERVWRAAGLGEAGALGAGLAQRPRLEAAWWKGGSASLSAKAAGSALVVTSLALAGWWSLRGEPPRALPAAPEVHAPAPSARQAALDPAPQIALEPTLGPAQAPTHRPETLRPAPSARTASPRRARDSDALLARGNARVDGLLDEITALRAAF